MSLADDLERLAALHRSGALSDAEFASAKARALAAAPAATPSAPGNAAQWLHALRRSRNDRWLGGVCGGLAPATGLPSWVWRLIFGLLVVCGGTGVVAYLLAWILVPMEDGRGRSRRRLLSLHLRLAMKTLLTLVLWCLLFLLCWPVALAALLLWPLVWLVTLPLRLLGIAFEAVFALLRALLFLPARLLGTGR